MKAILVIDVDDEYIYKEVSLIKFTDDNAIYCNKKLKPMPQKRILPHHMVDYTNYGEEPWFTDGFNACIDEILGEEE